RGAHQRSGRHGPRTDLHARGSLSATPADTETSRENGPGETTRGQEGAARSTSLGVTGSGPPLTSLRRPRRRCRPGVGKSAGFLFTSHPWTTRIPHREHAAGLRFGHPCTTRRISGRSPLRCSRHPHQLCTTTPRASPSIGQDGGAVRTQSDGASEGRAMHDGSGRIAVQNLTKQFGAVTAVQNLSFTVEPGSVTGFLGPNGAGKTTTLRMLLGLVTPTSGAATINGRPYTQLGNPARVVGSVLENEGFHPRRTARNHLRVYAAAIGVPDQRVDEMLGLVGLTPAADRPAGGYSLGMRQRLSLATALLGDPQVLVLDEPSNGL